MKVHASGLKHGIGEADIPDAAAHPVYLSDPDDMPAKHFGVDAHGWPLEAAILAFDSGDRLVIPAMKARPHFTQLLE